jgi:MFS family permease
VPNSLALLSASFPKPERGRAIGIWSGVTALFGAAGPVVGGWLVDRASWRAAFLFVVPLAALTVLVYQASRLASGEDASLLRASDA